MAEDERTVESTADAEDDDTERDDATVDAGTDERQPETAEGAAVEWTDGSTERERTPDDAAETFLELDADLDVTPDADVTGYPRRGIVADADRVAAERVPSGYPLSSRTDRAVELTVDFGDGTTTVYLAWPDDAETETGLTWLLDAMGIDLREL